MTTNSNALALSRGITSRTHLDFQQAGHGKPLAKPDRSNSSTNCGSPEAEADHQGIPRPRSTRSTTLITLPVELDCLPLVMFMPSLTTPYSISHF